MKQRHIIVVGGGASGMVAAIVAARQGARVTIIEQKERLGKKILSTGNGHCNLTNAYMEASCFRGDDTSILESVLHHFGYEDTLQFFEELGVVLKNRNGYIYPLSDQATAIVDVLTMEIARLQIQVVIGTSVCHIAQTRQGFAVETDNRTYKGDGVILATGGKAAPVLGSDGSGYTLAKAFGHRMSPVTPALVQLRCAGDYFKKVAGVRTPATVTLLVDGVQMASDTGELQLTNYGISGIPVFQVSRYASKGLYAKQAVTAKIDFVPSMSAQEWHCFIEERLRHHAHKTVGDFFVGIFHQKLTELLLKQDQIHPSWPVTDIYEEKWKNLLALCKEFMLTVEETNSFEQAQVCAGGIRTTEVHPVTMESQFATGLYLTGELLDIDGICGGYNLQWAWATGYLAGLHAAKGE